MKFAVLLLLLTCNCLYSLAQSVINPGGVKGSIRWYVTDTGANYYGYRSKLPNDLSFIPFSKSREVLSSLNFHPALQFANNNGLAIPLLRDFSGATIFTVYKPADTSEKSIWHIRQDQRTTQVLTSRRMANLKEVGYINFIDLQPGNPKVNMYVRQKNDEALTNNLLTIGSRPLDWDLPIKPYSGLIPEIVLFDKVLNTKERLQVASYLSLKYGVTLTEPNALYLNSAGDKIWDGTEYGPFHINIAGIGRDDSSGFFQKIATSSNRPGLLTISTNDSLVNNSFLLWGENGGELIADKKMGGLPLLLQKKWLIVKPFNSTTIKATVKLDTRAFDIDLPVKPVYWLAIDRTGAGNFSLPGTAYIKMSQLDANGYANFKDIDWDADASGIDVWGVVAAQDLLVVTNIDSPACMADAKGNLNVKIITEHLPWLLTITDRTGNLIKQLKGIDSIATVTDIATGKYILKVIDGKHQKYIDSFYVNNASAPVISNIEPGYVLLRDKSLELNASAGMPSGLQYQWEGPFNFQSNNAAITISQPGLYILACKNGDCISRQDVMIKSPPPDIFNKVIVYPNPSSGMFSVKIGLNKVAPVNVSVYTAEGKLVTAWSGNSKANYIYQGTVLLNGQYEVLIQSGPYRVTKQLIISK